MSDLTELKSRVRALEDLEAIKKLKARYFRCLDRQLWKELRGCFADDATAAYQDGELSHTGADTIVEFLSGSLGPAMRRGRKGMHLGHHPEIELTSDSTAQGIWALDDQSVDSEAKTGKQMRAHYHDTYVKVRGEWKIQHTGYVRLYDVDWDIPSLHVSAEYRTGKE